MRKYLALLSFIIFCSCKKSGLQLPANTPGCVKTAIEQTKNDPQGISQVDEYLYQNKIVYLFRPTLYIADAPDEIKDDQCNTICFVGGYGGPAISQCNGENFYQKAVLQRTIWKR